MNIGRTLALLFVGAVLVFLFLPVAVVVLYAFAPNESVLIGVDSLTTRWFGVAFENRLFQHAAIDTAEVALVTAVAATLVGTLTALGLRKQRGFFAWLVQTLTLVPLIVPGLVIGIALVSFFSQLGFKPSLATVTTGHFLATLPLATLIVTARLAGLDPSLEEASRSLGATNWQTFRRILFPLMRPAIAGAAFVVAAWSVDEFVITFFTVGSDPTMPIVFWGMLRMGVNPSVNAVATVILALTVALTLIAVRWTGTRGLVIR